ncbi:MAG: hypothetical protein M1457_12775, partial [bacterium]|nr:hypothetical protein [bacterium]
MDYRRLRSESPLIMASLFIAFVIWLIAKQGNLDTDWIEVPIRLENVPVNVEVKTISAAQVKFQFPQDLSNRIVTRNFEVVVNAGDIYSGDPANWKPTALTRDVEYTLARENVRARGDQFKGIEVLRIDPQKLTLTGTLLTRTLAIDVKTTGASPANLVFTAPPRPDPPNLLVTGSPEALRRLSENGDTIRTRPVDLSTLHGSDQKFPELVMPPGVIPVDKTELNRVTVDIGLSELDVTKTFYQVPISLLVFSSSLTARV